MVRKFCNQCPQGPGERLHGGDIEDGLELDRIDTLTPVTLLLQVKPVFASPTASGHSVEDLQTTRRNADRCDHEGPEGNRGCVGS